MSEELAETKMVELGHYTPLHQTELRQLLASPAWQEVLASGLVEAARSERLEPGKTRDFIATVVEQLLELNETRVKELIVAGETDLRRLRHELGRWPAELAGRRPKVSFLGLNLTAECNFVPRCVYCNQPWVEASVGLEGWKQIIEEVTRNNEGVGPYIYLTGGEPLVLGEEIWGEDGLIAYATRHGAAVNVNTNALLITPEVALRLVRAGLTRLHISLDTADETVQNFLLGGARMERVLEGIYHVQLARDLTGAHWPEIHTNCVLTKRNLELFPELLRFLLARKKQTVDRQDPFRHDLLPHVIPVGGRSNDALRPSSPEFRRFYGPVWDEVCTIWDEHQATLGVAPEARTAVFGYFSNPFLRVEHRGGLEAYAETSARGRYGSLALPDYCYVAPTQGSYTPDGLQFRCGSHAIRRIQPIGQHGEGGFFDHVQAGIAGLDALPDADQCHGCALATLYINQAVEKRLDERVAGLVQPVSQAADT
ncbi:MAG: radical SAM protein [Candidatus Latescibacterota bacterium]